MTPARVTAARRDDHARRAAGGRRADRSRLFVAQLQRRTRLPRPSGRRAEVSRTCRASTARARSSRARRRNTGRATKCSSPATNWAPAIGAAIAAFVRVPAEWIVPLPSGLSLRDAMIYGTAGFTAAQCVTAIVERGIGPERGEVVVTGATGGVGSLAVAILAKLGYEVAAVTGKADRARLAASAGCGDRFSAATTCSTTTDRPLLAGAMGGGGRHGRRPAAGHDSCARSSIAAAWPPAAWSPGPSCR